MSTRNKVRSPWLWVESAVVAMAMAMAVPAQAMAGAGAKNYYQSYSYYGTSSADLVVRPDVILINFRRPRKARRLKRTI
jgi:hypothetical protein